MANVFQLTHIAWEGEVLQQLNGRVRNALGFHPQLLCALLQKMAGQYRYVFTTLTQRWQTQADDVQAVKQILAECTFLDTLFQILVRGGDHPHIGFDGAVTTYAVKTAVRQDPQQAGLQIELHVTDFIQEQGTTIGLLETPTAHGLCACESTTLVAKEFAFQQIFGNSCGVDGHKRAIGTLRMFVQSSGNQLFARTRLAGDHHGDIALAQATNGAKHILHGRCLAQHFRRAVHIGGAGLFALTFFHCTANQLNCFGQVKRFGQVLKRTTLESGHRTVQIGIRRHDDDRQARHTSLHLRE